MTSSYHHICLVLHAYRKYCLAKDTGLAAQQMGMGGWGGEGDGVGVVTQNIPYAHMDALLCFACIVFTPFHRKRCSIWGSCCGKRKTDKSKFS